MLLKEQLEKQLKSLVSTKDAQDILSKATEENEDYTIRFKITNESQDRDWETIVSKGIDWTHFDKNPVFLIDHKYTVWSIAWKVINREIKGTETYLTVSLAKWTSAWELVKTLHEQWMIKGVSIWFMPLQRDANDRSIITKSEALEASAVAIGSNREALMDEKTIKTCKELWVFKEASEESEKNLDNKEEIDLKSVFNIIKKLTDKVSTLGEEVCSLRKEIYSSNTKSISDDKEKEREQALLNTKRAGEEFKKQLSEQLHLKK